MPGLGSAAPVARRAPGRLSAARRPAAPTPTGSGLPGALVDVPVGDRHVEALVLAVALEKVLGDRDRTVASTGAADRDHEVRLALGAVLRQQKAQQRGQPP